MNERAADKQKVEAIYPLNTMQEGILLHHLMAEDDQGFLNVQCVIEGDLDLNRLKQSWEHVIQRHAVLRTSVHWEDLKKPVQLVRPQGTVNWVVKNWTNLNETACLEALNAYKKDLKTKGLNLKKSPLTHIHVIQTDKESFYLIWSCHHLLLDGWSSSIILKDVFSIYDALKQKKEPSLPTLPSYKSYLNWLKGIDPQDAKAFWIHTFKDFKSSFLFNTNKSKIDHLSKRSILLTKETTQKANDLAKSYQITTNTLYQGIWALILSKYSNSQDIIYGNTVSGRSGAFPNIALLAGMFTNVLPLRVLATPDSNIKDWFKTIQLQQLEARKHEHFTIDDIAEWIQHHSSSSLYDSLFIYENFPWDDIKSDAITVHSTESGITTTYPVTLTVKTGTQTAIYLAYNDTILSHSSCKWIFDCFEIIINALSNEVETTLDTILKCIPRVNIDKLNNTDKKKIKIEAVQRTPKNKTELELLKIWETLFNKDGISTNDNFFEIGGTSMMAIRLFTRIEKTLKVTIPPITLLKHNTIEALSNYILKDDSKGAWNYVVPIKPNGTKNPLFCIHGGGGFVFFFNPIANALDNNTPVYAIQPSGTNGHKNIHQSIEDMSADYAREIKEIQPKGPYNLLVYCFSPAVGIEIADIYKKQGDDTNLIVIDSIIKQEDFTDPTRIRMRLSGFLKRFLHNPFNAIKLMVSNNYERFLEPTMIRLFASTHKKNLEQIKQNLIRIYKRYKWDKKHPGSTTLILTNKPDKKLNPTYIEAWEGITDKTVEVLQTEGQHHQLFSSPHADLLAKKIQQAIIENN